MLPRRALWPAFLLLFGIFACSGRQPVQTVQVPPRIDLTQHEMIGIVDFDSTSKGELAPLATRRFAEWSRQDQGLVRVLWLGTQDELLRSVGRDTWDMETFKAIGREYGVRTIVSGRLIVSDIRPDIQLSSLRTGSVSAQVDATLAVEMIETSTGASIWNRSADATKSLGHVSVFRGRDIVFDADDPEQAYGVLVDALVEQVTRDFRATWVQR